MRTVIFTDFRCKVKDSEIYISQQANTVIKRYADVFGSIVLCSRSVENVDITDTDVKVDYIEKFVPVNSLLKILLGKKDKIIKKEIENADLVLLRLPAFVAIRAGLLAKKIGKKCFAECMADPWDGLWNHGLSGKVVAPYIFFNMKKVVRNADYALYVTDRFLQQRYPCSNLTIGVSDVKIDDITQDLISKKESYYIQRKEKSLKLMTTAAVNVKYKGQQFVIKSLKKLREKGINVTYTLVGGGDNSYLKILAKKKGVDDLVQFAGLKTRNEIFNMLDEIDVYIQPSLQEGLPRALVEAMSRGCVCVGAKTGGIPELLEESMIVRKRNVRDIERLLLKLATSDNSLFIENSKRNISIAKNFQPDILDKKRIDFFNKVLDDLK